MSRLAGMIASHSDGIGVRKSLDFRSVERRHRAGIIEPDVFVELLRQHGLEVLAGKFRLRPVDDADRALQPRLSEALWTTPSRCGRANPIESVPGKSHATIARNFSEAPAAPSLPP